MTTGYLKSDSLSVTLKWVRNLRKPVTTCAIAGCLLLVTLAGCNSSAAGLSDQHPPPASQPDDGEVGRLIAHLASPDAAERDEAELRLWRLGRRNPVAMVSADSNDGSELSLRVRRLLQRFDDHLTPDTPADVQRYVCEFHAADAVCRKCRKDYLADIAAGQAPERRSLFGGEWFARSDEELARSMHPVWQEACTARDEALDSLRKLGEPAERVLLALVLQLDPDDPLVKTTFSRLADDSRWGYLLAMEDNEADLERLTRMHVALAREAAHADLLALLMTQGRVDGEVDRLTRSLAATSRPNDRVFVGLPVAMLEDPQREPRPHPDSPEGRAQSQARDDARMLVWLYRAKGNLPAARRWAEWVGDKRLLRSILISQGDWAAHAELSPVRAGVELSEQWLVTCLDAFHARARGKNDQFEETLGRIEQFAPKDQSVEMVALALLGNDQPERAVALLRQHKQRVSLVALLLRQLRLSEARAVIAEAEEAGRQTTAANAGDAEELRTLHSIYNSFVDQLVSWPARQKAALASNPPATSRPAHEVQAEIRRLLERLAAAEAERVHVLKEMGELSAKAARGEQTGNDQAASECHLHNITADIATLCNNLAWRLSEKDDHRGGADLFIRAAEWTTLGGFLAGDAGEYLIRAASELGKAGEAPAADAMIRRACLVTPVRGVSRLKLIDALTARGCYAEAERQRRIWTATRPMLVIAASNDIWNADDYGRVSIDLAPWSGNELDALRLVYAVDPWARGWLERCMQVSADVHRYRALTLLQSGQPGKALPEAEAAVRAFPADFDTVVELVREFDAASRSADADRIFRLAIEPCQSAIRATPVEARLSGTLDWLATRCRRKAATSQPEK